MIFSPSADATVLALQLCYFCAIYSKLIKNNNIINDSDWRAKNMAHTGGKLLPRSVPMAGRP
jgi:hypothetical protein